ncbi:MAG TPA: MarR family transcriptional regulator [Sphingobacteriaceae bacterium]|nr:MarR family transcriptional regulator [Sphingobacteriaceae bacterium]
MSAVKNEEFVEFLSGVNKTILSLKTFLRNKIKASNLDLTFEMLQVLKFLWNNQNANQQEIANMTLKDKASLTYLIDNLTKRNLVFRTEDKDDRRNKLISLTPEGLALKEIIEPWIDEMYTLAGKEISPELLTSGTTLFKKINDNLEESKSD